ncbi:hypothetical protein LY474_38535 [Myxococcus stipitatus]|uniref:hypothetical protein n=1 Tax=Myxococcus stipitatus TaxID=83455 RepID=UPI001F2C7976|nr:hypothetical protein [Myxococcus stipitatus]MCE9673716.1 hypothetical protein [Myxococcus stipitatus]
MRRRSATETSGRRGTRFTRPYGIMRSGPWRPRVLVAKSFGRHRVFLAGDATHRSMLARAFATGRYRMSGSFLVAPWFNEVMKLARSG